MGRDKTISTCFATGLRSNRVRRLVGKFEVRCNAIVNSNGWYKPRALKEERIALPLTSELGDAEEE
jgi:hypothetical protein